MKVEKINQGLTLLANFGVIAGLIFLAFEIRQNTTAVQASAIQESTNVAREQLLLYATDKEMMRRGMTEFDELTELEQRQLFAAGRSYWIGMQGLYRQWQMGVLPDEEWEMWREIICVNFATSRQWSSPSNILIPSFVELVESCSGEVEEGESLFYE
jgi:hypothetical protein